MIEHGNKEEYPSYRCTKAKPNSRLSRKVHNRWGRNTARKRRKREMKKFLPSYKTRGTKGEYTGCFVTRYLNTYKEENWNGERFSTCKSNHIPSNNICNGTEYSMIHELCKLRTNRAKHKNTSKYVNDKDDFTTKMVSRQIIYTPCRAPATHSGQTSSDGSYCWAPPAPQTRSPP